MVEYIVIQAFIATWRNLSKDYLLEFSPCIETKWYCMPQRDSKSFKRYALNLFKAEKYFRTNHSFLNDNFEEEKKEKVMEHQNHLVNVIFSSQIFGVILTYRKTYSLGPKADFSWVCFDSNKIIMADDDEKQNKTKQQKECKYKTKTKKMR